MKRVEFNIPSLARGGAEIAISELSKTFLKNGFKTELVAVCNGENQLFLSENEYTDLMQCMNSNLLTRAFMLVKKYSKCKPDVVISYLESSNFPTVMACFIMKIPCIVSIRGDYKKIPWIHRVLIRILYPAAKVIVIPSAEMANSYRNYTGFSNVISIPNTIQIHEFISEEPLQEKRKAAFVIVGRMVESKNISEAIELAKIIDPNRSIVVVGSGPKEGQIRARYIDDRAIQFLGEQSKINTLKVISEAAMLISASLTECWPNVIAESLSVGTPVLARDVDFGPRELIRTGINGFLYKDRTDLNSIVLLIRRIFDSDEVYLDYSKRAKESVSLFSLDNVFRQWTNIINNVLK